MRVVALFRVSTEKQADEGASLDAQERTYRQLAEEHGWETVAEFRGCESASQAATDRRVLQEVLDCIRSAEPDAIYVHEQSRLTRGDELEVALLMRELSEQGLSIIIRGVVRNLASLDERFMVAVQGLIDRTESERIKERALRGKRELARQGKKNSGPSPFGYRNPQRGDSDRGRLQIVEDQAEVIRKIYQLTAAGSTARNVSKHLNALGIPSPRGGKWGKSTITRILINPAYMGVHVTNGWEAEPGSRTFRFDPHREGAIWVDDAHEPIIAADVWRSVNTRSAPPRTLDPHMLTGILWVDGHRYSSDATRGRRFYVARTPRDRRPWLDLDETNSVVWRAFCDVGRDPKIVEGLIREARAQADQDGLHDEIDRCAAAVTKAKSRLDRLIEMRADGEITRSVFRTKTEDSRRELAGHEQALAGLQRRTSSLDTDLIARVIAAVRTLTQDDRRLDARQRRRILFSAAQRIEAEVHRVDQKQQRGLGGQYLPGSPGRRWVIDRVRFHLCPSIAGGSSGDKRLAQASPHCGLLLQRQRSLV